MAAGVRSRSAMTSSPANWRLERLSAAARETAEIASLSAGLSLSAWLTKVIGETSAAEGVTPRNDAATVLEFAPEKNRSADDEPAAPRPIQTASAVVEPLAPRQPANPGAAMLSVAAMAPANLGTRSDEATPESLVADIAKRGVR